jgi:hypothetical protein
LPGKTFHWRLLITDELKQPLTQLIVTALHRHPVKSFTPERMERLSVMPDGRVAGDRVLAFRLGDVAPADDLEWRRKSNYIALANTPGMARMSVSFDETARRLRMDAGGITIADGSIDDDREAIAAAITEFVLSLDDSPLTGHPERQPLMLVGDGRRGLFHDTPDGQVTLYSEESLAALGAKLGDPALDGRRFRANIAISGVSEPFEELSWAGKRIAIGDAEFRVLRPVTRCLATHANPVTGQRDRAVMDALVAHFTPEKPQFAVMLEPLSAPCAVEAGATVRILD